MRARGGVGAAFVVAGALLPAVSSAVDLNFAGTLQLDYLFAPTLDTSSRALSPVLDGFTQELSFKLVADLSEHATATAKVCYGCHGFEVGMGYLDLRASDAFTVRAGRFLPTFGEFALRHDPGNHRLSDKPLPYDMGRMLRWAEFGGSVVPTPYVDQGVELSGTQFLGRRVQLSWAAHLVSGMRSPDPRAVDIDFGSMRSAGGYVIDNNARPTVGGRLGATVRLGERSDLTLGASALYGAYDPRARLTYTVLGADAYLRLARTNVRAEYLVRRTEMDASDPTRFVYEIPASGSQFNVRDGWYVEVEHPISRRVDLLLRWDGLRRRGNVLQGSGLDREASVQRVTVGAQVSLVRGVRLKTSVEGYRFTGLDRGPAQDIAVHLGLVGTF